MGKRRKIYLVCGVLALAVLISPLAYLWIWTKCTIAKILNDPTVPLSREEKTRVRQYIEGHFLFRAPWDWISEAEQQELVDAAIERTAEIDGGGFLLMAIQRAWHNQRPFRMLPDDVNDAIVRGEENAVSMLSEVTEYGSSPYLEAYISFDWILRESKDQDLIGLCCYLDFGTLYRHREAYLAMLKREDVKPGVKLAFLQRVTADGIAVGWFLGREQLLESLRKPGDERINEAVQEIRQQIRERVESVSQAGPEP